VFSALLTHRRRFAAVASVLALAVTAGACGTNDDDKSSDSGGSGSSAKSGTVGLLLPESKTTRYEAFDHPLFEKKLKELCSDCKLLYANANQDAAEQQSQAESMLTQGVDVLVLDPVDGKAAQAIVTKAKSQDIPVVSYDRLASGPVDYYVSFDNMRVGQLQGQALLKALGPDPKAGPIVMINGAPTDPNAAQFKKGAHSVLDGKVDIGKEYDTPDWTPDKAQTEAQAAITALGKDKIIGFYSANDGMAGGITAAIQQAGFSKPPPLTGQDAELAGIQRIVAGTQTMTVYKPLRPLARGAATAAVQMAKKEKVEGTSTVDNGLKQVQADLLRPIAVHKDLIDQIIIQDRFYTREQVYGTAGSK
jgi:D-xylose transport system substrate-binding protein